MTFSLRLGAPLDRLVCVLTHGLEHLPGVQLFREPSPELVSRLDLGTLDAAILPVTALMTSSRELLIVPGLSISTEGTAPLARLEFEISLKSVECLVGSDPFHPAAILTELLFAASGRRLPCVSAKGQRPIESSSPPAKIVIGDLALQHHDQSGQTVDLSQAWSELTGLPFVWAVWVTRPGVLEKKAYAALHQARSRGKKFLEKSPESVGLEASQLRHLCFRLGKKQINGILKFWDEAHRWGLLPPPRPLTFARFSRPRHCTLRE